MSDVEKGLKKIFSIGLAPKYIEKQEKKARKAIEANKPPVIPIPDDSLRRTENRRRRAIASKTGRESTILTGLGG